MEKSDTIISELLEFGSSLPSIVTNTNVFKVPLQYFEELPARVLLKINAEEMPLTVPSNYFNTLSDEILHKIKYSYNNENSNAKYEMQEISPVLAALSKVNCYSVPAGYFSELPATIIASIPKDQPAKVINMRKMPAMVRYLIAAAFTGLIGFSIFSMFTNNNKPAINSQVMAEANSIVANGTFDAELSTLSATDIENYLQESGHDPDAAVAAAAINDNNLPDQLDYLLNENTLDDYLNKTIAN